MFTEGQYSSYRNYVTRAKTMHVKAGHEWTERLALMMMDATRSVTRGPWGVEADVHIGHPDLR